MIAETKAEDAVFKLHDQMHPKFWVSEGVLQEGLRPKLLAIAQYYIDFLKLPPSTKLRDITFTGSLAGYNYTDYSDVDIHIILDYGQLSEDQDFVMNYFKALKDLWSEDHEVTVFGFPVELFAQDVEQYLSGPGAQYSLVREKWVKPPQKTTEAIDRQAVIRKAKEIRERITSLCHEDHSDELMGEIEALWGRIKNMRQTGLNKEGEYSNENLAFKVLRNTGVLQKLTDLNKKVEAEVLSITEAERLKNSHE
jgi:hypothetical protein